MMMMFLTKASNYGALSMQRVCVYVCTASFTMPPLIWLLGHGTLCLHGVLSLAELCSYGLASLSHQLHDFGAAS